MIEQRALSRLRIKTKKTTRRKKYKKKKGKRYRLGMMALRKNITGPVSYFILILNCSTVFLVFYILRCCLYLTKYSKSILKCFTFRFHKTKLCSYILFDESVKIIINVYPEVTDSNAP